MNLFSHPRLLRNLPAQRSLARVARSRFLGALGPAPALCRLIRKLMLMDRHRRAIFFQAFFVVGGARVLLVMMPMRKARPLMPMLARVAAPRPKPTALDELLWALSAANRRVSGACLSNALAAEALLARYGYMPVLRIGATLTTGTLTAHAWVEHGGEVVIGGPESVVRQYSPFPNLDAFNTSGLKT